MLDSFNGRPYSKVTRAELEASIKQDWNRLTPEQRATVMQVLAELRQDGQSELLTQLNRIEYKRPLVDFDTFVLDPYYLGNTAANLFPRLRDDLRELFEGNYQLCLLAGSIGYGKTFGISIGICRVLYELSCMADPHGAFGIAPGTNISVVCFSVTEFLAQKVVMENITAKLLASPYFQEHFRPEVTKKEIRFPNSVWVAPRASNDNSALGLNVISAFMDEVNFLSTPKLQVQAGGVSRAEGLFAKLYRRMKSRFERGGKLPGKLFVVSSAKSEDDFTAQLVRQAETDPTIFVRNYALWDVHPEDRYSPERFSVLVGNETVQSRLLEPQDVARVRAELPEGCTVIDVPETFRPDFERDLDGSIQDLAGLATSSTARYMPNKERIAAITAPELTTGMPSTHVAGTPYQIDWSKLTKLYPERRDFGARVDVERPILNPMAARVLHIDIGLTGDAAGIAMGHVSGHKRISRYRPSEGHVEEVLPEITCDLLLQVVPPTGGEIELADLRELIYLLSAHGYRITAVTLDSYQSVDTIQTLKREGYVAGVQSVDRTMEPYDSLKAAIYEGRLHVPEHPVLLRELRSLYKDVKRKKVDHPLKGSKDVSDALAGVVFKLMSLPPEPTPTLILPGGMLVGPATSESSGSDTWPILIG